jgi:hypothetical protein
VTVTPTLLDLGPGDGGFEQQRVDERLGQVAAQLALGYVELFGEESGRSAGGAGSLKPTCGGDQIALLVVGESEQEAAQQERPF